jgi:replicative DNA helicase
MVRQYGVQIIFVDYVQIIESPQAENRKDAVERASKALKAAARQLDVPIVAAAQLGRQVDARGREKRPVLADFQYSSKIEQDADAAILIHQVGEQEGHTQAVEAIVAKNRDGQTGTVRLEFTAPYVRFTEESDAED